MARAKVFFTSLVTPESIRALYEKAELSSVFSQKDFLGIKLHFGEPGNTAYLKPANVKPIVEMIEKKNHNFFLTDANTIYKGARADAVTHQKTAKAHGFDFAPIIIADGLSGHDFEKIPVNFKHFKEVWIGSAISEADALIVVSHFKGHDVVGFGGALKNLGMGSGCRSAKQQMHADVKPKVIEEKCTSCGKCEEWCPTDAALLNIEVPGSAKKKARIYLEKCIGCGECVAACNFGAININWGGSPISVQEKFVEYCGGIIGKKKNKIAYINFIIDVSPNCDCYGHNDPPVVPDIGIVASLDPVAIDQASLDLVNKAAGKNIFQSLYPDLKESVQLSYAEKIGLGTRDYELIKIN